MYAMHVLATQVIQLWNGRMHTKNDRFVHIHVNLPQVINFDTLLHVM